MLGSQNDQLCVFVRVCPCVCVCDICHSEAPSTVITSVRLASHRQLTLTRWVFLCLRNCILVSVSLLYVSENAGRPPPPTESRKVRLSLMF